MDRSTSKESLNKRLLLEEISDREKRSIVIVLNEVVKIKGKKYLNIVGIDVFTGRVIKIVDTNGYQYGLHTFNEKFSALDKESVIKATFKICKSEIYGNLLRITSEFIFLGYSNINKLYKKYKILYKTDNINFLTCFQDIFQFSGFHEEKQYFFITNFKGTKIQFYKGKNNNTKYQLKMDTIFVDIIDNSIALSKVENLYFKGLAIISIVCLSNGSKIVKAHRLIGDYLTEEEYIEIGEKIKISLLEKDARKKLKDEMDYFYKYEIKQFEEESYAEEEAMYMIKEKVDSRIDEYDFYSEF